MLPTTNSSSNDNNSNNNNQFVEDHLHHQHHHQKTLNPDQDLFKSSLLSIFRTLLVISIITFLIFIIYYLVPASMGWFTPPSKGGSCHACHSLLKQPPPPAQAEEKSFQSANFRQSCTCDCWDGRAKGPNSRGSFKFIYYQVEGTTLWLAFVTILILISFYQSVSSLLLLILNGNCNYALIPMYILGWYGVYYGYGAHFNYFNEGSHQLSWHQFYFTISEIVMLFTTCMLMDSKWTRSAFVNSLPEIVQSNQGNSNRTSLMFCKVSAMNYLLWIVLSCSLTHIAQIIHDQGLEHFGELIFIRDIALMMSDVPYVLMCVYYLRIYKLFQKVPVEMVKDHAEFSRIMKRNLVLVALSVVVMVFLLSTVTFGG